MTDTKTLFRTAHELCGAYLRCVPPGTDHSSTTDDVLVMLFAAQMLGSSCVGSLERLDVDLDAASETFRQVMSKGTPNTARWLNILSTFFAMEASDPVEAAIGLAVRATKLSGGNQREALVTILAAAKILASAENMTVPEAASTEQQAELLKTKIDAFGADEDAPPSRPMSPGGSA